MIFTKNICLLAVYTNLFHAVVARQLSGNSNSTTSLADNTVAASSASISTSSDTATAAAASNTAAKNSNNNGGDNNNNNNNGGDNNNNNNNGGASASNSGAASLTLNANALQTGSQLNGLQNATAGQAASDTDNANFINFCSGKTLTNGLQLAGGSCNGVVMGDIPNSANMISTIINNPGPGDTITANQDFTVNLTVLNLVAGSFTNPDSTYYAAPQQLVGGKIQGHVHVTIQSLNNNIATTTPPDPATFAFFKGINDAGNGNGGLSANVVGGLAVGVYRVCTLTSASNHQSVNLPLAQRGATEDCNKFTVVDAGGNSDKGIANSNTSSAAGAASTVTSSASSASSSTTSGGDNGRNKGDGKRFVLRNFVA